jgi:iron complex outermembrane recepter protein
MLNNFYIKRKRILLASLLFFTGQLFSQEDSVALDEVIVRAYLGKRTILRLPAAVVVIDSNAIQQQPGQSLVPLLNTVPGVRMEERSPGSYRLSVRGSLLRSPFGVRNIKVYLDEFPLTNAGGETYLNLLDVNNIHAIEILKGPDGSLFGANSGGVVRIDPVNNQTDRSYVKIAGGGGSYGLFQENAEINYVRGRNVWSFKQSWQGAQGYRANSKMDRKFFQAAKIFNYKEDAQLRVLFFYSDLNYQTPGGLTLAQYEENPKQARPATKTLPGAVEQKAGIHNRTFFGGVVNEIQISEYARHVISVFGSQTSFENPFITNYETRDEGNAGARTWFEFKNDEGSNIKMNWQTGGELQEMQSVISNYGNVKGFKDTVQAIDDLEVRQCFGFSRLGLDFYNKVMLEASLSYNYNRYIFSRRDPIAIGSISSPEYRNVFQPQLMPRVAISYIFKKTFSLRAIVSRGYSPPTIQEVRSSDNRVNTSLQPESGWNYEAGWRLQTKDAGFYWDVSAFYYELRQAIVRRLNDFGQEYFINAGITHQPGLESTVSLKLVKQNNNKFVRACTISNSTTFYQFTFDDYVIGLVDYSGKKLTGVPEQVVVSNIDLRFPLNIYLFAQHNFTQRIPLDDANKQYSKEYQLVQVKMGWRFVSGRRFVADLSAGADNLLDEKYSLGNDLNAFGGRYFNAAPGRNYFGKIVLSF